MSLTKLDPDSFDLDDLLEHYNYRSLAPLEAHYMAARCFIPDNSILDNASALAGIPTSIVHGRYDIICLAQDACKLHQHLPGSQMHFVCAGHSASEEAIKGKLVTELGRLAELLG